VHALQVAHFLGSSDEVEKETTLYKLQNAKFTLCYEAHNRRNHLDTCSMGVRPTPAHGTTRTRTNTQEQSGVCSTQTRTLPPPCNARTVYLECESLAAAGGP
jgi:hypothetical protein